MKPIDALYRWRQLQTKYDSSQTRENSLKKIISSKDAIIASQKIDNIQLRSALIKVQPDIDKKNNENEKLKEKNRKLTWTVVGTTALAIFEAIILLK